MLDQNCSKSESGKDTHRAMNLPGSNDVFFLDIFFYLVLIQHPFATYEKGAKLHDEALKDDFGSMPTSQIKISYKTLYPEIVI